MSSDADTEGAKARVAQAAHDYAERAYPTGTGAALEQAIAFNAFVVGAQFGLVEAGRLFDAVMKEKF